LRNEEAAAACGFARRQGTMFARKIGDGSEDSSQQVMGAISNCIGFFHLRRLGAPDRVIQSLDFGETEYCRELN